MRWKLVFVAAAALVLAITAPIWNIPALAQASILAPTIGNTPPGHPPEHPKAWATITKQPMRTHDQPQAARRQSQWLDSRAARQAAPPGDVKQERRLSPGAILGLICSIAASSVALGIAFGLRRRIDRIAGPDPDKNDDD